MAKTFYAVKVGITPGIYETWAECQNNVNGYPGAVYKKFDNKEAAKAFVDGSNESEKNEPLERIYTNAEAVAYVDGSYDDSTKYYAYGVVVFCSEGQRHFAEKFNDAEGCTMRNVAGEIKGAMRAMKFCIDEGIDTLDLFYDYEGIEKWCTNAWKANKPLTRAYKDFYNKAAKDVKVTFVKVKAHSGNKYNELADELAKAALGLTEVTGLSDKTTGVVAQGIKASNVPLIIELLQEDFTSLTVNEKDIPYGKQYKLHITAPSKQEISISVYEEKNKLWINGIKADLFNRLVLYLVELLETEEIAHFLNTVHDMNIDNDVVDEEFVRYFPNAHSKLPTELANYLHQAVYHLHVTGKMYVANYLVEPVLRPMEGLLKVALQKNNIPIIKEEDKYGRFFVFKEISGTGKFVLKEEYKRDEHSKALLDYLSRCYSFYHYQRNTLFHWDNPLESADTTRILNTAEEAHAIIMDAIAIIDEYYSL